MGWLVPADSVAVGWICIVLVVLGLLPTARGHDAAFEALLPASGWAPAPPPAIGRAPSPPIRLRQVIRQNIAYDAFVDARPRNASGAAGAAAPADRATLGRGWIRALRDFAAPRKRRRPKTSAPAVGTPAGDAVPVFVVSAQALRGRWPPALDAFRAAGVRAVEFLSFRNESRGDAAPPLRLRGRRAGAPPGGGLRVVQRHHAPRRPPPGRRCSSAAGVWVVCCGVSALGWFCMFAGGGGGSVASNATGGHPSANQGMPCGRMIREGEQGRKLSARGLFGGQVIFFSKKTSSLPSSTLSPNAVDYPPTAVGYPPTAVGYPLSAIGWSCADSADHRGAGAGSAFLRGRGGGRPR